MSELWFCYYWTYLLSVSVSKTTRSQMKWIPTIPANETQWSKIQREILNNCWKQTRSVTQHTDISFSQYRVQVILWCFYWESLVFSLILAFVSELAWWHQHSALSDADTDLIMVIDEKTEDHYSDYSSSRRQRQCAAYRGCDNMPWVRLALQTLNI